MPIINKPFWGIKDNQYTNQFRTTVDRILQDPVQLNKALSDLNGQGVDYVSDANSFLKETSDKIVGPVHNYIKNIIDKENGNVPSIIPVPTPYPIKVPRESLLNNELPIYTGKINVLPGSTQQDINQELYNTTRDMRNRNGLDIPIDQIPQSYFDNISGKQTQLQYPNGKLGKTDKGDKLINFRYNKSSVVNARDQIEYNLTEQQNKDRLSAKIIAMK